MGNPSPQRGDVFWVNIPAGHTVGREQQKRRPWVILSCESINNASHLGIVVGVPLSMKAQKANPHFRIFVPDGNIKMDPGSTLVPADRVALTEQVRAISLERLQFPRAGVISTTALYAIEVGVAFVMGIPI